MSSEIDKIETTTQTPDPVNSPALAIGASLPFGRAIDNASVAQYVAETVDELPFEPEAVISRGAERPGEVFALHARLPNWRTKVRDHDGGRVAKADQRNLRMVRMADRCLVFWNGKAGAGRALLEASLDELDPHDVFVEFYREGKASPIPATAYSVQRRL